MIRKVEILNEEDLNNNAGNRSSPDGKTSPESVGRDDRHSDQSDDGLAEKSGLYTGQKVPLHWYFITGYLLYWLNNPPAKIMDYYLASEWQTSKILLLRCFHYSDVHYSNPHCIFKKGVSG